VRSEKEKKIGSLGVPAKAGDINQWESEWGEVNTGNDHAAHPPPLPTTW
jgi:hypothetical protein